MAAIWSPHTWEREPRGTPTTHSGEGLAAGWAGTVEGVQDVTMVGPGSPVILPRCPPTGTWGVGIACGSVL